MTSDDPREGWLRGGAGIAAAMVVMNIGTYAFQLVAARILGPHTYGAIARLMATLLVVGVIQLGLQATAARRISADPQHLAQIERGILRVTLRAALALGVLMLLLAPVLRVVLRVDSLAALALLAASSVPLTVMGGQAGILQGERRWGPLSALYVAVGLPRVALGAALMTWQPTETMAMLAVAIGLLAPVTIGWWALRAPRTVGRNTAEHRGREILREVTSNSHALLAFFVLTNLDVIIAVNVLDRRSAGLYAGGLIIAKAVLFLPQFVMVVTFPSLSAGDQRRSALFAGLLTVTGLGAACTGGTWLLSGLALAFAGGGEFGDIQGRLWRFALLGTAMALLQLLVYVVLARQGQRSVYFIWAAVVAVVALGFGLVDSLDELLAVVTVVDLALFALLLGLSAFRMRNDPVAAETTPA